MPHPFEMSFESPASVEQVLSAFSDEEYWLARIEAFGSGTTLDSLTVDPDGTATVATTRDLRHGGLPGILGTFYRRELNIVSTETWRPVGNRRVGGEISVAMVGAPGSGHGTALLEPVGSGSRLKLDAIVEVKVALVGGTIESHIARQFAEGLAEIQDFTTGWIAERA
jgi:hypothetical protein